MNSSIVGVLYVVATPIGNLQDISYRALEILKKCSLIIAEDTRHCKILLNHYGVTTPVKSLHEHNEQKETPVIVQGLLQGQQIALVSDAGTPLISDPGYYLVQSARQAGIRVSPIPGACAAIAALSVSGLATDKFIFEGFLPTSLAARRKRLEFLKNETRTLIFYEAPHRIQDLLENLQIIFGETRHAVLAREMTKLYETIYHGPLTALVQWVKNDPNQQRGEMVVVVEGHPDADEQSTTAALEKVLTILLKELPLKQAVQLACELTGERKNKVYKTAVELNTR